MDDTISRRDTLQLFETAFENNWTVSDTIDALENLPSVRSEPKWIPVTERLPEYYEPVLTWDGNCCVVEKRIPYICDDEGNHVESDWWVSDDYDEAECDYYSNLRDGAAIAWMPLPKPRKGEEE